MMAASAERPEISDLSKATADEVRALYGLMIGDAGASEISGNQVTIRPIVAKIPVVMNSVPRSLFDPQGFRPVPGSLCHP